MKKLYLLCGIPVSGKSSVASEIAAIESAVILSYDEIKRELYDLDVKYKRSQDKEVFRVLRTRFDEALETGRNIVIDCVNGIPAPRRRHAICAKKKGYRTICVFCHKHYAYAITANALRDGGCRYPYDSIIKTAFDRFVPPERHEGWDEIHIMDGNRYCLEVEGQILVERRSAPGKQKR